MLIKTTIANRTKYRTLSTMIFLHPATFLEKLLPGRNSFDSPWNKSCCPCHPPAFIGLTTGCIVGPLPEPILVFPSFSAASETAKFFTPESTTDNSYPASFLHIAYFLFYAMKDGDSQFSDDFLMLSLSPPFSQHSVIPISYSLLHQSSTSSSSVNFSSIDSGKDDANSPFLTLFTQVSQNTSNPNLSHFQQVSSNPTLFPQVPKNPSDPTLSLFPEFSENLADFNNTSPLPPSSSAPSTDLCLSLPSTSTTAPPRPRPSTDLCLSLPSASTTQCSIGSQDSSVFASSTRKVNASANSALKRKLIQKLGEDKFVRVKKFKCMPWFN